MSESIQAGDIVGLKVHNNLAPSMVVEYVHLSKTDQGSVEQLASCVWYDSSSKEYKKLVIGVTALRKV